MTLELGGKTPVIILPDADLDLAAQGAARAIFTNAGQICNAGSRLYVHASVFDRIMEGVASYAMGLKLGSGLDSATQMGPVISADQQKRINGCVETGLAQGASLYAQGSGGDAGGSFVPPTILTGTTRDMAVVRQEIFGPGLCAMAFDDEDLSKIAREANGTDYGLGAVIWTNNLSAAHRLSRMVKAGRSA